MLSLQGIHASYGESHILKGISFEIEKGQVATLLGRNGAGKTTTLRTIMGLVSATEGAVIHNNEVITNYKPHQIASRGVGYVPEERAIFPSLSVLENLTLPAKRNRRSCWDIEKIYSYFPILESRGGNLGSQLSGGEQQMLAIARVLTMDINLLILDEPTEGLAPMLVREIADIISEIRKEGITILLVEQNTRFATEVADLHYIIYNGQIAYKGTGDEFEKDHEVKRRYLAV